MQVLASQLHFLANRNAGLAILPLFWPVTCIKIGGHVVLLSCPTVHSLYCGVIHPLHNRPQRSSNFSFVHEDIAWAPSWLTGSTDYFSCLPRKNFINLRCHCKIGKIHTLCFLCILNQLFLSNFLKIVKFG